MLEFESKNMHLDIELIKVLDLVLVINILSEH